MDVFVKRLKQAIRDCPRRTKVEETDICDTHLAPCVKIIDEGKCRVVQDVLKEIKEDFEESGT